MEAVDEKRPYAAAASTPAARVSFADPVISERVPPARESSQERQFGHRDDRSRGERGREDRGERDRGGDRRGNDNKCHTCGSRSHFMKDCPERRSKEQGSRQQSNRASRLTEDEPDDEDVSEMSVAGPSSSNEDLIHARNAARMYERQVNDLAKQLADVVLFVEPRKEDATGVKSMYVCTATETPEDLEVETAELEPQCFCPRRVPSRYLWDVRVCFECSIGKHEVVRGDARPLVRHESAAATCK